MINTEITGLLEKYFEGDTTLEQESSLKAYFNGAYDQDFAEYAEFFQVINKQALLSSDIKLPQDLELTVLTRMLISYWDCNSTLEDEKYLKDYFNGDKVHSELEIYKNLFTVLRTEAKIETGKLSHSNIDGELKSDVQEAPSSSTKSKVFSLSRRWMAVAASLLIGMMFWINVDHMDTSQSDSNFDISTLSAEEQEAYEVTVEALAFLSGKLDKSSNSIGNDFKKVANADIFK